MPKPAWGALVACHLAALPLLAPSGCSSPPPAPPAAPGPPAAPAPPVEAPTAASMGEWTPLLPLSSSPLEPSSTRAAPFSKGVIVQAVFTDQGGRCHWAEAPEGACSQVWFAPWKGGDDPAGAARPLDPEAVGPFSSGRPAKAYHRLFAGRDGVYGLRTGDPPDQGTSVDLIDERGVKSFRLVDTRGMDIDAIIETGAGPVVVGSIAELRSRDQLFPEDRSIAWAPLLLEGTEARVGKLSTLRLTEASDAKQARVIVRRGKQVVFFKRPLPSLDKDGKLDAAIQLLWVEALPPPFRSPRSSQEERERLMRRYDSCGSAGSRALYDESVIKKVHLFKLGREGGVLGRKLLATTGRGQALPPLPDEAAPGGVKPARQPGQPAPAPPSMPVPLPHGTRPQKLLSASFDVSSGEGAALVDVGGAARLVKLGADGKPLGEPLAARWDGDELRLLRLADGWVVSANVSREVKLFGVEGASGGAESARLTAFVRSSEIALFPLAAGRAMALVFEPPDGYSSFAHLRAATLSLAAAEEGKFVDLEGFAEGDPPRAKLRSLAASVRLADGTLVLAGEGQGGELLRLTRQPSGQWSEPLRLAEPGWSVNHAVVEVPGDRVIVFSLSPLLPSVGMWLRAGVARPLPVPPGELQTLEARFGPIGKGASEVLPAEPGDPIAVPDDIKARARGCRGELRSGPRSIVLLCDETVPGGSRPRVGVVPCRL